MYNRMAILVRFLCLFVLVVSFTLVVSQAAFAGNAADLENLLASMGIEPFSTAPQMLPESGGMSDLSDSLALGIAGKYDDHFISFGLIDTVMRPGVSVLISFPDSFGLTSVSEALYSDNDDLSADLHISALDIGEHSLSVAFAPDTGATPIAGSVVTIEVDSILNPRQARDYQLALTIFDENDSLIAGPMFSAAFAIDPDSVAEVEVTPSDTVDLTAGETILFAYTAWDIHGNEVEGATAIWSLLSGVISPGELSANGIFFGTRAGIGSVVCEVDGVSDTTVVSVTAGEFNHFEVSGFPSSLGAGERLAGDIEVGAYDFYGNRVLDFSGQVWFVTTDTAASVLADSASPFVFSEGDSGFVAFPGDGFAFRTAGLQEIYATDGSKTSGTASILVEAGDVFRFKLTSPSLVTAGVPFEIAVDSIADSVGNFLDLGVRVELTTDSVSPGGDRPVLASFLAENGFGSAEQILVNADTAALDVIIGDTTESIDQIIVRNAPADHFEFYIKSPQIVGIPFEDTAFIKARDEFNNVVVDFNAEFDDVTITPNAVGEVNPSSINSDTAFVDGVCDLTRFSTKYDGVSRFLTFTATSRSGVSGISNTLEINSWSIVGLLVRPEQLYKGDELIASVSVQNFGSTSAQVVDLQLTSSQGDLSIVSSSPLIPHIIEGNSSQVYELRTTIPESFSPGWTKFKASFRGLSNQLPIADTSEYFDSTKILSQQFLAYSESSLAPTVVTKGENYSFTCDVVHNGLDNISLNTSSILRFISDSADTFQAHLANPIYVPATGQQVTLFFEEEQIGEEFQSGEFTAELHLRGLQGFSTYDEEITLEDGILIQTSSLLRFFEGSFQPDSAFRGTQIEPSLTIVNEGEATLIIDPEESELLLVAGDDDLRFLPLDSDTLLAPGENLIRFLPEVVRASFPLDDNSLSLVIDGRENQLVRRTNMFLGENLIVFLRQAAVRLTSVSAKAPNIPKVNTSQDFLVTVNAENVAEEALSDIWIGLDSDGSSLYEDSLKIDLLQVGQVDSVTFTVTASIDANPAELFIADVLRCTGAVTGHSATILSPIDNTVALNIQDPAMLVLSAGIDSPASASDGVLGFGQNFHVAAELESRGESSVGYGIVRLSLPLGAGFETIDDSLKIISLDEAVGWDITAPESRGSFQINVELVDVPIDSNTAVTATIEQGSVVVPVSVIEEELKLRVSYNVFTGELISPGEQIELVSFDFAAFAINPESEIIIKELVFNLSDRHQQPVLAADAVGSAGLTGGYSSVAPEFDDARLVFDLGDGLSVKSDQPAELTVLVTIKDTYSGYNLFFELDSTSVSAIDNSLGLEGEKVPVVDRGDNPLAYRFGFGVVSDSPESSFFNYPNPFAAGFEATKLVYTLPDDDNVTLEIFTLIGEKVFSETIAAGDAGASKGRNEVIWNGTNSRGDVIRNGVYIGVLTTSSGIESRTKIAVVK